MKNSRKRGTKHYESKTKLFERWASMQGRCKPTHKQSKYYFDKGIKVCDEWDSFIVFKEWAINNGFSDELQLDRKDNNKGYYPENCRWVIPIINNSNRDITVFVEYEGEKMPLALLRLKLNWDKKYYRNIQDRISRGWTLKNAMELPIKKFSHLT